MIDISEEIESIKLKTKKEEDILTLSKSLSINEETVYLKVKYKIFKGFETDKSGNFVMSTNFGKTNEKKPTYSTFSIDRIYKNNYFGLEEMQETIADINTEEKVRTYFKL